MVDLLDGLLFVFERGGPIAAVLVLGPTLGGLPRAKGLSPGTSETTPWLTADVPPFRVLPVPATVRLV